MMYDCLVNGEISTLIAVNDRGFQYGHGVFETLAVERGVPLMWEQHMARLRRGCRSLGIPAPEGVGLLREIQTVCTGKRHCVVKVTVTAGSGGRGYKADENSAANRIVASYAWPENMIEPRSSGVKLRICEQRLGLNRPLAKIKHLNRLEQVLASSEWDDPEIADGLIRDSEDFVISATSANLFVVSDGLLLTPRLDRCGVRGVVRDAILGEFTAGSEKRRVTMDFLNEADEVFICNSIRGIWPVVRIEDREFDIGPRTRELQDWLAGFSPLLARRT